MSGETDPVLPLAVHIGFAGPRRLIPAATATAEGQARLLALLREQLATLPQQLCLSDNHFITAVSQLAEGADLVFTDAAASLGWLHRVVLPQPIDDYLAAAGSDGPDFSEAQRERVQTLLSEDRVLEVVVASTENSRTARFEDANLRIVAEADVIVVLRIEGTPERPGGTAQLLRHARQRHMRRLVLTLSDDGNGMPRLQADWEGSDEAPYPAAQWPACVQQGAKPLRWSASATPSAADCAQRIKEAASERAAARQRLFRSAAKVIVWTHIVATALALIALKAPLPKLGLLAVLIAELGLLAWGYRKHHQLHHEQATIDWAMARLCAEVARSTQAVQGSALSLTPLHLQLFPAELRPMLKSLYVMHLRDRRQQPQDWRELRDRYLAQRLEGAKGQIQYYETHAREAHDAGHRAATWFGRFSMLAGASTGLKTVLIGVGVGAAWHGVLALAGPVGILAPVVAVGIMSVAAAMDVEGRAHTFDDTWHFVRMQAERIRQATSEREYSSLMMLTEARLLNETLGWVGRRAHLGVT